MEKISLVSRKKVGPTFMLFSLTKLDMDKRKDTGAVLTTYKFFSGIIWRLIFMKSYGDVNEAYVEKNRGIFRRCFGIGKYNKRDFSQKKLKNIWDW